MCVGFEAEGGEPPLTGSPWEGGERSTPSPSSEVTYSSRDVHPSQHVADSELEHLGRVDRRRSPNPLTLHHSSRHSSAECRASCRTSFFFLIGTLGAGPLGRALARLPRFGLGMEMCIFDIQCNYTMLLSLILPIAYRQTPESLG